ncbi:MAG: hypothetical protein JSV86_17270 [Gemmatimonadota bacterium]|nr:MAG: hypothetical protein JSV86_17270 [Gemmatimonadota bacterium]
MPHLDGCMGCSATLMDGGLFGLGQSEDQLQATADGIIREAGDTFMVSSIAIAAAMTVLDKKAAQRLGQILIAKGVDADKVADAMKRAFPTRAGRGIWGVLSTVSAAACAYHGYKRNESIGWAVWWFIAGGLFFPITPVIAVAQGFGKPK